VYIYILVGGLEHVLFSIIYWDVILPIDELIFFKMFKTPTRLSIKEISLACGYICVEIIETLDPRSLFSISST